jgi:hypothetical protein
MSPFDSRLNEMAHELYHFKTWKYTVNFRNIGNSFVNKAVFVDTISSKLPLNRIIVKSFYPVGGKPPYIQPGNVLVVNFDPANLQAYETNPSKSMGWVEYDVEQMWNMMEVFRKKLDQMVENM